MPVNDFAEGVVLRVCTFFKVKTYDLISGQRRRLCTVPFLKTSLLEKMDSRAVLVVFGPLLQEINHCSGTFLFYNFFF
jgi:hypothetical protein